MATKTNTYCFRLTEEEHEAMKKIADSERRSLSNLLSVWIAEHIAKASD